MTPAASHEVAPSISQGIYRCSLEGVEVQVNMHVCHWTTLRTPSMKYKTSAKRMSLLSKKVHHLVEQYCDTKKNREACH